MTTETTLTLFIVSGWAVMIFVPSFIVALLIAASFGVSAAYMIHLNLLETGDARPDHLLLLIQYIGPFAGGCVFVAWPVTRLFKWFVRKNTTGI